VANSSMERVVVSINPMFSCFIKASESLTSVSQFLSDAYSLFGRLSFRIRLNRSGRIVSPNILCRNSSRFEGRVIRSKSSGIRGKLAALMPNCIPRYKQVGVFPHLDTPTRITSAVFSSFVDCPSSEASAKLTASIRFK